MHTPQRTEVVTCFDTGPARASPVLAEDRLQPYQESLQAGGPVDQDGIHMSRYLVPRLTTVRKDSIGVGREAVKQLLIRISEPDLPRQKVSIPSHLIIRESTGPAPL